MSKQSGQNKPTMAEQADRHTLYQESVQFPEAEVDFMSKTFQKLRGRKALSMKEDFCGTAYLATEWCKSDPERTAIGVDFDGPTL
ncbi:MAG: class I SAM-dependent methyltransferase, partial [Gammaproteobacteria bacterium]|nr:class I SAM-dependent methyltransferase [Gammaproteobacteria bacterium]